jgi:phosphoribosyl 1,2-cyclic phosphodiesterase
MPADPVFTITYWGVTGTIAAPLKPDEVTDKVARAVHHLLKQGHLADLQGRPGDLAEVRRRVENYLPFHVRSTYGGDTTCLEVQTPDALLILDCGSGFRGLASDIERRWNAPGYQGQRVAHVLITHPHMDHTIATPFADCYFDPRNQFTLYASKSVERSMCAVLCADSELSHTYFPPDYDLLKAIRNFKILEPDMTFPIGSTKITTYALNHPGGCLGFKLENAGRTFVFATDHEHRDVPDRKLAAFARGADLLYMDGQYLQTEYDGKEGIMGEAPLPRRGWGHSSVEACVATAAAAGVRRLHIGHIEPKRNDDDVARIECYFQQLLRDMLLKAGQSADACQAQVPYEGLEVRL